MKRDAAARAIIRNNLQFRVVDPDQKIDIFVSPGMFCIGPPTFLRQRHPSGHIDVIARTSNVAKPGRVIHTDAAACSVE